MIDLAALAVELQDAVYADALKAATTALAAFPLKPGDPGARDTHDAAVTALDALAQAVNGKTVAVRQAVPGKRAAEFLTERGIVAQARFVSDDPAQPLQLRVACQTLRDAMQSAEFPAYDLANPEAKTAIDGFTDGLIAAGVMTPDHRDGLYALGQVQTPFWQTIGAREVDHGDIIAALGHAWDDLSVPGDA